MIEKIYCSNCKKILRSIENPQGIVFYIKAEEPLCEECWDKLTRKYD